MAWCGLILLQWRLVCGFGRPMARIMFRGFTGEDKERFCIHTC